MIDVAELRAPTHSGLNQIDPLEAGLRERLNIIRGDRSIRWFAAQLGTNPETMRRHLQSGRLPASVLCVACDRFHVDPQWLLTGKGVPNPESVIDHAIRGASSSALAAELGRRLDRQFKVGSRQNAPSSDGQ